jgi:hypothetical protein
VVEGGGGGGGGGGAEVLKFCAEFPPRFAEPCKKYIEKNSQKSVPWYIYYVVYLLR